MGKREKVWDEMKRVKFVFVDVVFLFLEALMFFRICFLFAINQFEVRISTMALSHICVKIWNKQNIIIQK